MISKYLIERAIDMLPIASDDATRFHLCGVYIVSEKGKVTLTATDGSMLLTREYADQKCPEGKYMLRKEHAPALKALLKAFKRVEEFEVDATLVSGMSIGPNTGTKGFIGAMEGQYPDYNQVIPKPYANRVAITFNAEYLLALATALMDGNKRGNPEARIVFDPCNPNSPIRVEKGGKEGFTAVLVPIRDEVVTDLASERRIKEEERE